MNFPDLQPFIFIRHGETAWNAEGRFQGRTDLPLNDKGRLQAAAARGLLRQHKVSLVLTSPLRRAVDTAIASFPDLRQRVVEDPLLIECDFGSLDGRSIAEVMSERGLTKKEQLSGILPDDGEQWASVAQRCRTLLTKLGSLQKMDGFVVLVGHDAVLQCLSEILTSRWFDSRHAQPYLFSRSNGTWQVVSIEDV